MTPIEVTKLLNFERSWLNRSQHDGRKEQAIRETFGLSATRYYQQLVAILDTHEALAIDPMTVAAVRRRRDARKRQRSRTG